MSNAATPCPPGIRLDGDKYAIEEVLGSGGLVYQVRHRLLGEERAIKEYLPSEIAVREGETVYARSGAHESDYRDGLYRFLKEAQQLVRFDGHPNIIRCRDYFEDNSTAYPRSFSGCCDYAQHDRERARYGAGGITPRFRLRPYRNAATRA